MISDSACECLCSRLSFESTGKYGVDLAQGELVELNDVRLWSKSRRYDHASLIPVIGFDDDPHPVIPVLATPVGMRGEVGPPLEEGLDDSGARLLLSFVRDLDQETTRHSRTLILPSS